MTGTWLVERENWSEAKTKLARCKKLCEHFLLAADQARLATEASSFHNECARRRLRRFVNTCRSLQKWDFVMLSAP